MATPYSKADSTRHAAKEVKDKAKPNPIPKKSKKLVDAEKIYKKEHKAYLLAYPYCEVNACKSLSNQIHHKKGRIGSLLYNPEYFMAVCGECHSKIELNPIWAKVNGYSIIRL